MKIQECYLAMGSNYEMVLARLRSEALIRKFAVKFLEDPSYDTLCRALEEKNAQEAFRAAHTLKGVSQNLGFDKLQAASSGLTDALRDGNFPADSGLFQAVQTAYDQTVEAIRRLDGLPVG